MRVFLLIPPMTQLNTPYPSTAYLTGFLKKEGYDVFQSDPALELVLRLFSRSGLNDIRSSLITPSLKSKKKIISDEGIAFFFKNFHQYENVIDPVIQFLQGHDPSLAVRIVNRNFLPEGPRFRAVDEISSIDVSGSLSWAFGSLGIQDHAKYLSTLLVDDLADVIQKGIDPKFQLSRYGETLAASSPTFKFLEEALKSSNSLVDIYLKEWTQSKISELKPDVVGLSVPFPGNVYGAFRMAQEIKKISPQTQIILGGGYVNTELRELKDPKVFEYVDFITLDDGEKPILCILEHLQGKRTKDDLLRTFIKENKKVVFKSNIKNHDIPHKLTGIPTYQGLPLSKYLSLFEMLNPMHRIWSDGRWNKVTLAHGCYWKKCNFCDTSLDYIGRYDPANADLIIDRIESMIQETGQRGFHFVDEAAPPAVLKAMAQRLLERKVTITWWGNIRFEKTFTPELTELLARSGCIAVSGGLEVASNRLLKLMNKGVSVEQVAQVTQSFTQQGIMVHAYLMYGFPTQTVQETIDALERVRQLFQEGCIQSAYWHRFSVTAHSPIGKNPEKFGIKILPEPKIMFARNDLDFEDSTECDHDQLGEGLRNALYQYMHGLGLEDDVRVWFKEKKKKLLPAPKVPFDLIKNCLRESFN